jgi:hypothetical protein
MQLNRWLRRCARGTAKNQVKAKRVYYSRANSYAMNFLLPEVTTLVTIQSIRGGVQWLFFP